MEHDYTDASVFTVPKHPNERPNNEGIIPIVSKTREYKMDHQQRGRALIFDHYEFKNGTKREPADKDAQKVKGVLELYGFTVEIHKDLCRQKLTDVAEEAAQDDYTNSDCVLVVVMTHGTNRELSAYDKIYQIDELVQPFAECKTLIGKPKIFIIQSCRGGYQDYGHRVQVDSCGGPTYMKMPVMSDILIMYSSFYGYVSFRDPEGAPFIQNICAQLEENQDDSMDLFQIFTMANQNLAFNYEHETDLEVYNGNKQVATIMSSLTRLLYLRKKNKETMVTSS